MARNRKAPGEDGAAPQDAAPIERAAPDAEATETGQASAAVSNGNGRKPPAYEARFGRIGRGVGRTSRNSTARGTR